MQLAVEQGWGKGGYTIRNVDKTAVCVCVCGKSASERQKNIYDVEAAGGELKTIFKLYYIGNIMLNTHNWIIQRQQMWRALTKTNTPQAHTHTHTHSQDTHEQDKHTYIYAI